MRSKLILACLLVISLCVFEIRANENLETPKQDETQPEENKPEIKVRNVRDCDCQEIVKNDFCKNYEMEPLKNNPTTGDKTNKCFTLCCMELKKAERKGDRKSAKNLGKKKSRRKSEL